MRMGRIEKLFVNSRLRAARAVRHAERMLHFVGAQAGMRYLDVGCGTGAAAIHVARRYGLNVVGLDVDREQIEVAAGSSGSLRNIGFLVGEARQLPFGPGSFDVVTSSMVTHHVPDWETAITEMARVVRPGGFIVHRDLRLPRWISWFLAKLTGSVPLPTESGVRLLAERNSLHRIRASTWAMHYEAVWRKA